MTCPQCGDAGAQKVIYLGLPMRLCGCSCLFGRCAFVVEFCPTDGESFAFMVYQGSYWRALWVWLKGGPR